MYNTYANNCMMASCASMGDASFAMSSRLLKTDAALLVSVLFVIVGIIFIPAYR